MPPRGIHLSARRTAIFVGVLCFSGRLATAADDHDHDHAGHHHHVKCECLANEQGWSIDCTNAVPMTNAVRYLNTTAACDDSSPTEECEKQYHIMQAHHDHCRHDEIDHSLKRMIHDFETLYEDCTITRKYDPALTMCPDVDCSTAGIDLVNAKTQLTAYGCDTDCSSTQCLSLFHKVVKAHDTCMESDLPTTIENALHDFEDSCTVCNSYSEADTPTLDTDHCSDARATSLRGAMLMASVPFLLRRP